MAAPSITAEIKIVQDLDKSKELGRGCFGSVYEVRVNGVPCIAKRLHDILVGRGGHETVSQEQRAKMIANFRRECVILSGLRHPNVVQFMGVHYGSDEADISIVMEYLHIDLDNCMRKYSCSFPLSYKIRILRDVAYGLAYLHSIPIIHRDLNAGNVLLTESLKAKVADLGMAKMFSRPVATQFVRTMCPGAPDFMSPESLSQSPRYSDKLDVFSFGHLAIYLVNQQAPHVEDSSITKKDFKNKQIQIGKRRKSLEQMGGPLHPLYGTVVQCLSDTPDQRPTSKDLVERLTAISEQHPIPYKNTLEILAESKKTRANLYSSKRHQVGIDSDTKHQIYELQARLDAAITELSKAEIDNEAKTEQQLSYINETEEKLEEERKRRQEQLNDLEKSKLELKLSNERCMVLEEELIKVRGRYKALLEVFGQSRDTVCQSHSNTTGGRSAIIVHRQSLPIDIPELDSFQKVRPASLYSQQSCAVSGELVKRLGQRKRDGKNVFLDDKQNAFEAQQESATNKSAASAIHAQTPTIAEVQSEQDPEDTNIEDKKAENKELAYQKPKIAVKSKTLPRSVGADDMIPFRRTMCLREKTTHNIGGTSERQPIATGELAKKLKERRNWERT